MLRQNVPLKNLSNYKIGGNASYFLDVKTKEDLIKGIKEWQKIAENFPADEKKIFILGGGTNILFSDDGFKGLVVKDSIDGIQLEGERVICGSGTLFTKLLEFCIEHSLSGLEWAGGMPGTVGGAIRGNAGAFGGETKDNIENVTSLNLNNFETIERNKQQCEFSYRSSIFKVSAKDELIISVIFNLQKSEREKIETEIQEKADFRKNRHPLENPNAGSVFKNVPFDLVPQIYQQELSQYLKNDPFPVIPTGKLIFLTGLKGRRVGDAAVSDKHTNFIINLGNAKAKDVSDLITIIKNEVKQKFGISLEEEIMLLK